MTLRVDMERLIGSEARSDGDARAVILSAINPEKMKLEQQSRALVDARNSKSPKARARDTRTERFV